MPTMTCLLVESMLESDGNNNGRLTLSLHRSYNHEKVDAETYASWGIDFVEEDSCHHGDIKPYIPCETL